MPMDVFAAVPTFSQPSSGHTSRRRQTREATEIRKDPTEAFLNSEKGEEIKTRVADVETVLGDIEHYSGFNRFMPRDLEKRTLDFKLIAAGHNRET